MGYEQSLADWRMWRDVSASDTALTSLEPSNHATYPRVDDAGMISVKLWSQIAVKLYGVGAENADIDMYIWGWMEHGPGDFVYSHTDIPVGTHTFTESLLKGYASGVWREADDWTTGTENTGMSLQEDRNATLASLDAVQMTPKHRDQPYVTTSGAISTLYLPTYGYTYLQLQLVLGTCTRAAAIWRPTRKFDT